MIARVGPSFCFQMTSLTKEPKLFVVAGCLRGLASLMVNFTKTMDEGGLLYFTNHGVYMVRARWCVIGVRL